MKVCELKWDGHRQHSCKISVFGFQISKKLCSPEYQLDFIVCNRIVNTFALGTEKKCKSFARIYLKSIIEPCVEEK